MENYSNEKTMASRRGFAKSIVAAIAALPFVSALTNAQGNQRRGKGVRRPDRDAPRRLTQRMYRDRNEHDTPPPVLLMQGSCIFEVSAENNDIGQPVNTTSTHKKYKIKPKKNSSGEPDGPIFLAHIKIVDGSGEMLFRYDNYLKDSIVVSVTLADGELMKLSAVNDKLEVDLKKTRKLGMKLNDTSMNAKRTRFRFMDDTTGGNEYAIKLVEVTIRNVKVYSLYFEDLTWDSEETKLMMWWEKK